jgi:hypothetical protein
MFHSVIYKTIFLKILIYKKNKTNKMITTLNQFLKESSNEYETLASTSKYGISKVRGGYRIDNYKGLYHKILPYIDIQKVLADELMELLINYKDYEMTKSEGVKEFNKQCDEMFDEEHSELYPSSVK